MTESTPTAKNELDPPTVENTQPEEKDTKDTNNEACPLQKSRFSPTVKGAAIGAVAGSILPVFGTISGAIIGAIAGKVYEKKCAKNS